MKITTTEGGYLSKSCAFERKVRESNFEVHPMSYNFVDHLMLLPDQVDAYITTNGGGELSKNHDFCHTANKNGYDVTSTATDASFQNGMVERPYQILKERMRCMLYAARLGTEFWFNAIIHVTWLYNRTYHSAIGITPYEAYTGCIPSLNSLITFGTKITAKRPGNQSNTLNPWTYDDIFLGYQNTKHNIWYWDVHTGTTKIATHDSKDELQIW